jgi:hypothetical protein
MKGQPQPVVVERPVPEAVDNPHPGTHRSGDDSTGAPHPVPLNAHPCGQPFEQRVELPGDPFERTHDSLPDAGSIALMLSLLPP